ncbi:MAG: hemerythrin family protein [Rhodocyclaceae bacterium]|nr:hemerythrin family protein [Rhodocyclaceae bacterium]
MPLSRFIADLDELVGVFDNGQPPGNRSFESLRVAVARMNEIRRQTAIAQERLNATLAIAENELGDGQAPTPVPVLERELTERFYLHDCCKTGIEDIDDEHRTLMRLGNRLYALSLCEDVAHATVGEVLTELLSFAQDHFAAEEHLMEAYEYPALAPHRATHKRMCDYLAEMFDLAAETPLLVTIRLEIFLGSWFIWHMQRDDVEFAHYCQAPMRGQTAFSAKLALPPR